MQVRASVNLPTVRRNSLTMCGNLSSTRPQFSSAGSYATALDTEYAFALGIDLERQSAAMQLEDRQIIRRSLDRDFPLSPSID
jgi:hypothetical protein